MTSPITDSIPAPIHTTTAETSLTPAYLALAGGIVCIGFSAIFVRFANPGGAVTTGAVISAYRLSIAALAMAIPVLINWRRGRVKLPMNALPFALLGGLFFAMDSTLWSTAVGLTTAANATLLGNTAPLWVGLGAALIFREKLRPAYWFALAVALTGVGSIIFFDALASAGINSLSQLVEPGAFGLIRTQFAGGANASLGNMLSLCSGAAYACYQLVTQRGRSQIDTLTYSFIFSLTGAVIALLISLILRHPLTGLPNQSYLALLGLGLISHLGGWLLINYAFGHLRASIASVTMLAQPIVTALVALPLLGETPTVWHVVGGAITLVGIYLVHRSMSVK